MIPCSGGEWCPALVHTHGCHADHGSCDSPQEHAPRCPACGGRGWRLDLDEPCSCRPKEASDGKG